MKDVIKSKSLRIFISSLAFIGEIGSEIAFAIYWKLLFDLITGVGSYSFSQVVIIGAIISVARGLFTNISQTSMEKTVIQIMKEYKSRLLNTYIETDTSMTSSEILNLVTHSTREVEDLYVRPYLLTIKSIIFLIGSVAAIYYVNALVVIVILAIAWIPLVVPKIFAKKNGEKRSQSVQQNEYFISKTKELAEGFDIIKAFHIEDKIKKLVGKENEKNEKTRYKANRYQIFVNNVSGVMSILVFLTMSLINVGLVLRGLITVGEMMVVVQIFNYVNIPIQTIPVYRSQMSGIKNKLDENNEFLKLEANTGGDKDFDLDDKIEIRDLSFAYGDKEVLSNLNLDIAKGDKVAVVGESGSGKSTLAKILLKRLRGYQGSICIDRTDFDDISAEDFYSKVSPVAQEVFLFNDSLRENIALYSGASDREIKDAIKDAGLVPVVEKLKDGIDTVLGEYGTDLSGGEKQRISIARCLIKDSQMIIMDEATSALDRVNARNIENLLLGLDQTVLVITHRIDPYILSQYDKIYVLRDGKFIESGKFEDLNYFANVREEKEG